MDTRPHKMLLVIDENVTADATSFLRERGHHIEMIKDWLGEGTKDRFLSFAANQHAKTMNAGSAIIVTHDKDFREIIARAGNKHGTSLHRVGRIILRCKESRARARLEQSIDLIEFEVAQAQKRSDKRVILAISDTTIIMTR